MERPLGAPGPERGEPTRSRVLLVYARFPRAGEGMPLVAAKLGEQAGFELQVHLLRRTLEQAAAVPAQHWLCFPEDRPPMSPPFGWRLSPYARGSLGPRLARGFETAFVEGARAVLSIDMECPALTQAMMGHAFEVLEGGGPSLVLGPSERGGYYLIGLNRPVPTLFDGIPWGTARLFRTTLDRALGFGVGVEVLPRLGNIEDVPDWERAAQEGWLPAPKRRPGPATHRG